MRYTATLRENATGLEREVCAGDQLEFNEASFFLWTEGNFGCDCNRAAFYAEAAGEADPDAPCGEKLFTAVRLTLEDGQVIPLDPV